MSWTQPVCVECWGERNPGREAVAHNWAPKETCCYCGRPTEIGIYVRVDPATVPYPQDDD